MLLLKFITQTFELLLVAIKFRHGEYVGHCERMLNLAPKLFRVLWDHRKLLRYGRELRAYHRSGREHDPANSFPQITGSLVVVWTVLHRRVRCVVLVFFKPRRRFKHFMFCIQDLAYLPLVHYKFIYHCSSGPMVQNMTRNSKTVYSLSSATI